MNNPGTQEAIDEGCICPTMDNEYGRGYMGIEGIFVHRLDCPVHTLDFESEKKMNLSENARLKDKIGELEAENERLKRRAESIECAECGKNNYNCDCLDMIALDEQV